jgi:hypothetical protein
LDGASQERVAAASPEASLTAETAASPNPLGSMSSVHISSGATVTDAPEELDDAEAAKAEWLSRVRARPQSALQASDLGC